MGYALGVDLGTTYTAAAICRDGRAEIATLGSRTAAIPSVVHMHDGGVLVGEAAERRAASEPDRVAREFKRRVGDTTPIFLGGSPYSAEALMSHLLRWTVDAVSRTEGGAPDHVAVSFPANWGPYKRELLDNAIRQANLDHAEMLTEPECAAIHYASTERVNVGDVVAVYDLGGGTFDAAVLRKTAEGWQTLGSPEGIERLGGIDFDAAVFAHVQRSLGDALSGLDEDDENAMAAVARLRNECVQAKEALSSDTDASIPVLLPNLQTQVRLTRGEFEDMVRPQIASTIEALRRALSSAGVEGSDVKAVLLVGGSSRIPLVAQMIAEALGRPVNVDAHPKHSIALGAALAAAPEHRDKVVGAAAPAEPSAAAGGVPKTVVGAGGALVGAGAAAAAADAGEPTAAATQVGPGGTAPPGRGEAFGAGGGGRGEPPRRGTGGGNGRDDGGGFGRKALVAGAIALGVGLLIGGGVVVATSGGGEEPAVDVTTTSSSTTSTTTTTPTTSPPVTRPRVTTTRPSTTTTAPTTTTTPTTTPPTT